MIAQPDQPVNAVILLASASPRRRELITLLGLPLETTSADIDEVPLPNEKAEAMAVRLSQAKAQAVLASLSRSARRSAFILLASDTVVSLDGQPLGKPRDAGDARSMLRQLRDRSHQVYTAITLIDMRTDRIITDLAVSDVPLRNYSDDEIEAYIASGDPFDKAGAYAIQHAGFHPVDRLAACFANVMGLPLCHVVRSLREMGVELIDDVPLRCQAHIQFVCPVFKSILNRSI